MKRKSVAAEASDSDQDNSKQSTSKNSSFSSPLTTERNPRRSTRGKSVNYKDLLDTEVEKVASDESEDSSDASSENSDYEPEGAVVRESERRVHENSDEELPRLSNRTTKSVKKKFGKLVQSEMTKEAPKSRRSSPVNSTGSSTRSKTSAVNSPSTSGKSPSDKKETSVWTVFTPRSKKKQPVNPTPAAQSTIQTPVQPKVQLPRDRPSTSATTPASSTVAQKVPEVSKETTLKMVDDTELKGLLRTCSEGFVADFERIVEVGRKVDRRQKIALYRLKDVITNATDKAAVDAAAARFLSGELTEHDVTSGTQGLMVPETQVERNKGRKASEVNPILLVTNRIIVSAFKKIKFTKSMWEKSPKWIIQARPVLEINVLGVSDRYLKSKIDDVSEDTMLEIDAAKKILDYEDRKSSDGDVVNVIRTFLAHFEVKKAEHWKRFIDKRVLATENTSWKYIFLLCSAPDDLYIEFHTLVEMIPGILDSKVLVTMVAKIVENNGQTDEVVKELRKINSNNEVLTIEEINKKLQDIPTCGVTLFEDDVVETTLPTLSEANSTADISIRAESTVSLPITPKSELLQRKPLATSKQETPVVGRKRRAVAEPSSLTPNPLVKKERSDDVLSGISDISGLSQSVSVVAAQEAKASRSEVGSLPTAVVEPVKAEVKDEIPDQLPCEMLEQTSFPLSTRIFMLSQEDPNGKMLIWTEDLDADLISTVNLNSDKCVIVSKKTSSFPNCEITGNMLKQLGAKTVAITQLVSEDDVIPWMLISLGPRALPASLKDKLVRSYSAIEKMVTDLIAPDTKTITNMVRHTKEGLFPSLAKELKGKLIACNFVA